MKKRARATGTREAGKSGGDESALRLAGIINAALDCIVTVDAHGLILEFNPAAERTFGYRAADVVGKPMAELIIPPSLRARHEAGMGRYLRTGEIRMMGSRMEITAMRCDGSEFPCELTITAFESGGEPVFTAFLRDITARRAAEHDVKRLNAGLEREVGMRTMELRTAVFTLSRVQQRLERAQTVAKLGYIELDTRTGACLWSRETFHLFGFEEAEDPPSVDEVLQRVAPEDAATLQPLLEGRLSGGRPPEPVDFRAARSATGWRWLRAVAAIHIDPAAKSEVYVLTLQDVTERKEAEENARRRAAQLAETVSALERARERLEVAQSMVHVGDLEFDAATGDRIWSKEVFRLYGLEPAAVAPSPMEVFSRIHPDDREECRHKLDAAQKGDVSEPFDYRVVWPDGSVHWLRAVGRFIAPPPGSGERRRLALTLHDITAQKAVEREMLATIDRERELGRLKADFLHMITHEYRTPLGIVISAAEILENYFDRISPEQRTAQLADIRREAKRLAGLVEEVLFLGRAESGAVDLHLQPVELSDLCRRFSDEAMGALVSPAGRRVEVTSHAVPARILLDERLMRHILTNLVHNALKYSPDDKPVSVSLQRDGDHVVITVLDEGIGIPAADQKKLFVTFQRASNVGTISGSGLGLVVVKRCVELHGGSISLRSRVGTGTEVKVRLPLREPGVEGTKIPR